MRLHFDEDFLEIAVFTCATGKAWKIPSMQITRFHRERERLYRIADADERNAAFFDLHFEWFREWGLEKFLTTIIAEYPHLEPQLQLLAFRKARAKSDEAAALYVNAETGRHGVVAFRAERFDEPEPLGRFLRHEFTHLHDMVDPAFGYTPELHAPGFSSAQRRLARDRYRLLWDITIDARLARAGRATQTPRAAHEAAFQRAYGFWPEEKRAQVFGELWNARQPQHRRLAELASDPRDLAHVQGPIPGSSCPLCGFPTFAWAPQIEAKDALQLIAAIRRDFPNWLPDHGVCARCVEIYEVAAIQVA
jgi:hypothetical protein